MAAVEGRHATAIARRGAPPALVFIGFMGAGKTTAAKRGAGRRPGGGRRRRAARGASSACRSPRFFGKRGRGGVPRPARRGGRAPARGRRRRRDRARRRRRVLGAGPRGPRPPRRRLAPGLRRGGVAAGRGQRPAAGTGPGALRGASSPSASRSTRGSPTRSCPPADQGLVSRALPVAARARASFRTGHGWPGRTAPRASTRPTWGRGSSTQAGGRSQAAASASPTRRSRASTAAPSSRWPGRSTVEPGERAKTLAEAERVLRELAQQGMTRDDHLVALGGGVVGDLGGLLRGHLPARGGGGAGTDDARGAGGLRLRRQDRRRPPRGQELRRRIPPAERRARRHGHARDAPAGGAGGRLRRGREDGAASPAATSGSAFAGSGTSTRRTSTAIVFACARTKLEVVAADERDAGRRAVLNLGHTVGHAIEAATGYERYRHGEAVGLGLLAALRLSDADELRDEVAGLLSTPRPADEPRRLGRRRRGARGGGARQEADGGRRRLRASPRAPGEPRIGQRVEPDALRAVVEELR